MASASASSFRWIWSGLGYRELHAAFFDGEGSPERAFHDAFGGFDAFDLFRVGLEQLDRWVTRAVPFAIFLLCSSVWMPSSFSRMSSLASSNIISPSTEFSSGGQEQRTELRGVLLHVDQLEPLEHVVYRPRLGLFGQHLKKSFKPLVNHLYFSKFQIEKDSNILSTSISRN